MANAITRTTPVDSRFGTRNIGWIEGYKRSATATGGGSNYIEDSALVGVAEENIVASGTSDASINTYYDGAGTRNVIYDAGQTFLTKCMTGMVAVRTDTGAVVDSSVRGAYQEIRLRTNASFPKNTGYEIHGFAKQAPANYLVHFQLNTIRILSGTGAGQVRMIKCVIDDGSTVKMFVDTDWETEPDATSVYVIEWSFMDLVYASTANAWSPPLGYLYWNAKGNLPVAVEINAEIEIGNNGTTTYFGHSAGYLIYYERRSAPQGWSDAGLTSNDEARIDLGEYSPNAGSLGTYPFLSHNVCMGWENGAWSREDDMIVYLFGGKANSYIRGSGTFGGVTDSIQANQSGLLSGYHTVGAISKGSSVVEWELSNRFGVDMYDGGILKLTNGAISEWNGNPTHNAFPANDQQGTNLSYNTRYIDCKFYINTNASTPNGKEWSRGVIRDETNSYGDWNAVLFQKSININVVDENGNAVQNAELNITDVIGTQFSDVDTGSTLNEDISRTATTFEVTNRENIDVGDIIRIDAEYMEVVSKAGATGTGDITVTREYGYSKVWGKTLHKTNTDTFDNTIYKKSTVLSDADGEFAQQIITVGFWTAYTQQVLHNGVYYTAKGLIPNWEHINKEPPNATYWDIAGSIPAKWRYNSYYASQSVAYDGNDTMKGFNEFNPWTITVKKAGYETDSRTITIDIDEGAVNITVILKKEKINVDAEVI